jgi:hypothetical protein
VRVEPWLNRATAFAKGAGLIELERGRSAKLTELGIKTLDAVRAAETVLTEEKAFVDAFGPLTTESVVNKIMRMELRL